MLTSEASGLRWLQEAEGSGGAPVPAVVEASEAQLVLQGIAPGRPTAAAAERFGRELARTHRAGARDFGAPWAGAIGPLPLDNRPPMSGSEHRWGPFCAARRIEPYLASAVDARSIDEDDRRAVEEVVARIDELCGSDEPPVWAAEGRVWLVDPAAHGGHRETDLAMLALFGAPHLDRVPDAYDEEWALRPRLPEPGGPPPAPSPARPRRLVRRSLRRPGRRGGPLRPRRERGLSARTPVGLARVDGANTALGLAYGGGSQFFVLWGREQRKALTGSWSDRRHRGR